VSINFLEQNIDKDNKRQS